MNLKWLATGLALGAAVAILYTPKAGAETRAMLRGKVDDVRRYVGRIREERWSITDVIKEGQEVVARNAEAVSGALDASADKFSEAL